MIPSCGQCEQRLGPNLESQRCTGCQASYLTSEVVYTKACSGGHTRGERPHRVDEDTKERFYSGNFAEMMGI